MSDLERLLDKAVAQDNGCLVWVGAKGGGGYGNFWLSSKYLNAHRAAWILIRGPIPGGLVIDHLCRNRLCVNVEHMELVTCAENNRRARPGPRTHCKRGHPLAGENLWISTFGNQVRRACATCRLAYFAKYKIENRARIVASQRRHYYEHREEILAKAKLAYQARKMAAAA